MQLLFYFFSFDAAQQRLYGRIFTRRLCGIIHQWWNPIKIAIPKNIGAQNVHFLDRKFLLRRLRTAAVPKRRGILGKLKQL